MHEYRDMKNYNNDTLTSIYQKNNQVDSENILPTNMAENFQDKIIFSLNAMCPLKSSNCSKPFAPWMQNSEVKDARKRKNL